MISVIFVFIHLKVIEKKLVLFFPITHRKIHPINLLDYDDYSYDRSQPTHFLFYNNHSQGL